MMAYINVKTITGEMIPRANHRLNSRLPETDVERLTKVIGQGQRGVSLQSSQLSSVLLAALYLVWEGGALMR